MQTGSTGRGCCLRAWIWSDGSTFSQHPRRKLSARGKGLLLEALEVANEQALILQHRGDHCLANSDLREAN